MSTEGYGRTVPAPRCGCGQPSEWLTGRGRWCARCLPADGAFQEARLRLALLAAERFGAAAEALR